MSRVVVGLDLSYTNTGIAVFIDGAWHEDVSRLVSTNPKTFGGDRVLRAGWIGEQILETVGRLTEPKIYIEDYAYASFANREAMGELGGIVKHMIREDGRSYETLAIKTIRKLVLGKGNAPKAQVMHGLLKRFAIDVTQPDMADACAVALAGDYVLRRRYYTEDWAPWLGDVRAAVEGHLKARA